MELLTLLRMSWSDLILRLDRLVDEADQGVLEAAFESRTLKFDEIWATRVHLLDHEELVILVHDVQRFTSSAAKVGNAESVPLNDQSSRDVPARAPLPPIRYRWYFVADLPALNRRRLVHVVASGVEDAKRSAARLLDHGEVLGEPIRYLPEAQF